MISDLVTALAAGSEVHLWQRRLDLDAEPLPEEFEALNADERARAGRFRRDVDRRRFIRRHVHLREVLARYLPPSPDRIPLEARLHHPPRLAHGKHAADLRISLSSSGDRSAVAVAWRRPVGVDIERIDPATPTDAMASTVFSIAERRALMAVPDDRGLERFFRIWARKEAFVKAKGTGLTRNLMSFDVVASDRLGVDDGEAPVVDREAEAGERPWLVRDVHSPPDFALACCAEGGDWTTVLLENDA